MTTDFTAESACGELQMLKACVHDIFRREPSTEIPEAHRGKRNGEMAARADPGSKEGGH
jgi:hypothetical protein